MLSWPGREMLEGFPHVKPTTKGCARVWALRHADLKPWMAIADLGCGSSPWLNGNVLPIPSTLQVILVDIESFPVSRPKSFVCIRADLEKGLPLGADSMDRVFCISVLEHLSLLGRVNCMGEIERILKPGGEAYISSGYFFKWDNTASDLCSNSEALRKQGSCVKYNTDARRLLGIVPRLKPIRPFKASDYPGFPGFSEARILSDPGVLKDTVRAEREINVLGIQFSEVLIGLKKEK